MLEIIGVDVAASVGVEDVDIDEATGGPPPTENAVGPLELDAATGGALTAGPWFGLASLPWPPPEPGIEPESLLAPDHGPIGVSDPERESQLFGSGAEESGGYHTAASMSSRVPLVAEGGVRPAKAAAGAGSGGRGAGGKGNGGRRAASADRSDGDGAVVIGRRPTAASMMNKLAGQVRAFAAGQEAMQAALRDVVKARALPAFPPL